MILKSIKDEEKRKAMKDLLITLRGQHEEVIGYYKNIAKYHKIGYITILGLSLIGFFMIIWIFVSFELWIGGMI